MMPKVIKLSALLFCLMSSQPIFATEGETVLFQCPGMQRHFTCNYGTKVGTLLTDEGVPWETKVAINCPPNLLPYTAVAISAPPAMVTEVIGCPKNNRTVAFTLVCGQNYDYTMMSMQTTVLAKSCRVVTRTGLFECQL